MKTRGIAVIYISHRLQEIFEIADEITVLRDGELIKTMPVNETNENTLTKLMVDRETTNIFTREKSEVIFKVEKLHRKNAFEPVSFEVRAGEVLGLSGLMGAGRTEIARCIFGLDKTDGETMWLNGKKFDIKATSDLQQIGKLSGGNQQKCCLAKILACKPQLLVLDEPTRGIDVGAKAD